jgi:hypothetical protein
MTGVVYNRTDQFIINNSDNSYITASVGGRAFHCIYMPK